MRLLNGITPATRLSIAICFVTASVMLVAKTVGVARDPSKMMVTARLRLAEAMALRLSAAATYTSEEELAAAADTLLTGYTDLRSIALRRDEDGALVYATDGHAALWSEQTGSERMVTHLALPIFANEKAWAMAEMCFEELPAQGFIGAYGRLTLFVALLGFLGYRLYLRRVLRYLDPSAVIPERVRAMLDTMSEGVLILDKNERIVLANQSFEKSCGSTLDELLGKKAAEIPWLRSRIGDEDVPWAASAEGGTTRGVEMRLRHGEKDDHVFMVNATPILGGDGRFRGAMATFDDVTAIERKNVRLQQMVRELEEVRSKIQSQNERLQFLATRDGLTGCLNRRALFERFDQEWSRSDRYGNALSCIMLDVDHFKQVNDEHGHGVGDQVLERVGATLRKQTRDTDVVGRYGGEEFCVVLPEVDLAGAHATAEKLRQAIASEIIGGLSVTASFGVSAMELGARSPQDIIDQADKALYVAKRGGRNRAVRWDHVKPEDLEQAPEPAMISEPIESDGPDIPFQAVVALMSALAQRDEATAAHSRRVADLCMMLARGLMTAGDQFVLESAALLHDIGKIGVPDAILLKPGPLTDEEWEIMESHDRIGIEIINSAFNSSELTNIVRNHHAFYGGSPRDPGLPTGRKIPIRARILTIADAYDAMVSDRVYRRGVGQQEAFAELRRCAGTQFDPDLVERFIAVVSGARHETSGSSEAVETALGLGLAMERLAAVLDTEDIRAVEVISERLQKVATRYGWKLIAEQATALRQALEHDGELADVISATHELLHLCHSMHDECLETAERARSERRVA